MAFRWQDMSGPIAATLCAALIVCAGSAEAQAPSDAPRAAPTTPVWTVPPPVGSQPSASNPDLRPSERPRYAVMDAGPAAAPSAPPQSVPGPTAPAPTPVSAQTDGRPSNPAHYSVMQAPQPVARALPRGRGAGPGPAYRLGTGDKLRVTVYGEPDLSGDFDVGSSGEVRLPLIGQVRASGLTVHGFEERVTQKLAAGYLINPRVSAEVAAYRPFFIIGEVNKPGQYPYVNAMSVVTAVALAGGYTYRADDSDVYVRRDGTTREVEKPADASTKIYPGDIIRVTERFF